jgi:hypothetical protein
MASPCDEALPGLHGYPRKMSHHLLSFHWGTNGETAVPALQSPSTLLVEKVPVKQL